MIRVSRGYLLFSPRLKKNNHLQRFNRVGGFLFLGVWADFRSFQNSNLHSENLSTLPLLLFQTLINCKKVWT